VKDYVFLVHSYEDRVIVINHRATGGRAGCIVIIGQASSPDPLLRLDMGRFLD
jgi:hypothetical protein